jgi:hypothetical protein
MNPEELNVVLVNPCRILLALKDPFVTNDAVLYCTPFLVTLSRA